MASKQHGQPVAHRSAGLPEDQLALNLAKDEHFICRDVALTDDLAANLAHQCRLRAV